MAPNDLSPMALIPAGESVMGSPEGEGHDDERPRRLVRLGAFQIDKYPVTCDQFARFCGETGRAMVEKPGWNLGDHPVVCVTWEDAAAFASWAGKRLPTEAEWEKAARGGTASRYFFGDDEAALGDYAWYRGNSGGTTRPVGLLFPNPHGLFDILGNVWEWTADWYDASHYARAADENPRGPTAGEHRVIRGGSWRLEPSLGRCAARNFLRPELTGLNLGFRCARDA